MNIGDKIRYLRELHGLTQKDLSEKINMNYSVLSRIESGNRPIRDEELLKLAKIFNVTTDYILGHSDSPSETDTVAAHIPEGVELTEEEQAQLDEYIQFILSRRKK